MHGRKEGEGSEIEEEAMDEGDNVHVRLPEMKTKLKKINDIPNSFHYQVFISHILLEFLPYFFLLPPSFHPSISPLSSIKNKKQNPKYESVTKQALNNLTLITDSTWEESSLINPKDLAAWVVIFQLEHAH